MDFIPEEEMQEQEVPYFQNARAVEGWVGYTTGKSIKVLQKEIREAMERLGGLVTGFKSGTFTTQERKRDGYQIHFVMEVVGDDVKKGRLEIAALPVKPKHNWEEPKKTYREQALRMALFMLRNYLNGLWYIKQLSPGYATLMPFIIDSKTGKTFSQLWGEGVDISHQLTSGEFQSDEPWWDVLQVDKYAQIDEIETAYRLLAKEKHPDNNGNHNEFVELQHAYESAKKELLAN